MPNYKVYITVYHLIRDIEADSPEEAKKIATEDYIWDDHIMDSIIEAEEITDESV